MKKLLAVVLTVVFGLSLTACDGASTPTTVKELAEALASTSPNYTMVMSQGDDEMVMKYDGNKAYSKMSMYGMEMEVYVSVGETTTTTYMFDEESETWMSVESDNQEGGSSSTFGDLTVDSYVEKDGYMVSEDDETAIKFDGDTIYAYYYAEGVVMEDEASIVFSAFGTTKITLPTVAALPGTDEEDSE